MPRCNKDDLNPMLDFLTAPEDEYVAHIDCSDCDRLASLAERVAKGASVSDVLPELENYLHYWHDCREEFDALVAVLKAEDDGTMTDALDKLVESVTNQKQP
ncbi:MAG: hypothetical protein SFZ02_08505 [bacterium]|nr:hypothetical protein [bacterium]